MSIKAAAEQLGVAPRSAQEFFAKQKQWQKEWWEKEEENIKGYFKGFYKENPLLLRVPYETDNDQIRPEDLIAPVNMREGWLKGSWNKKESIESSQKILVIADTQCKPSEDLSYMSWIGKYIRDKKPDVIVHIGDHYDMPSLSSYDKGKKSFEGRRVKADIEAGNKGMELLLNEFVSEDYKPRMVFCMGNHDQRLDRLANDMPELDGFVGTGLLPLTEMGWEVYDFLQPVEICGIFFVHYLANPFTGKPYSGSAANQLKTIGRSFVVGHKQCLDIAIRPVIDGSQQIGIVNGAAYPFDEDYKGYQGNNHFRGITMLHEVENGFALPMFVSMNYLRNRYS